MRIIGFLLGLAGVGFFGYSVFDFLAGQAEDFNWVLAGLVGVAGFVVWAVTSNTRALGWSSVALFVTGVSTIILASMSILPIGWGETNDYPNEAAAGLSFGFIFGGVILGIIAAVIASDREEKATLALAAGSPLALATVKHVEARTNEGEVIAYEMEVDVQPLSGPSFATPLSWTVSDGNFDAVEGAQFIVAHLATEPRVVAWPGPDRHQEARRVAAQIRLRTGQQTVSEQAVLESGVHSRAVVHSIQATGRVLSHHSEVKVDVTVTTAGQLPLTVTGFVPLGRVGSVQVGSMVDVAWSGADPTTAALVQPTFEAAKAIPVTEAGIKMAAFRARQQAKRA